MPNWGGGAQGAASGAALGSVVPGIGTAIGAAGGFLAGLFKKKKPKPGEQQPGDGAGTAGAIAPVQEQLQQSANQKSQAGQQMTAAGGQGMQEVMDYFRALTGNDPAALMEATKPERGRVMDEYDTARRSAATFGARGGATNAAIADSYIDEATALGDIGASAKREAAGNMAQMSATLAGLGLSAQQLASADLDSIIRATLGKGQLDVAKAGIDMQKSQQKANMWGGIANAAGNLLGNYFGNTKDGGGGDNSFLQNLFG